MTPFRLALFLLFLLLTHTLTRECRAELSAYQLNQLGVEAHQAGAPDRALDYFRRAHRVRPDDARIRENLAVSLSVEAQRLMEEGRYRDAAELLQEAEDLVPDNSRFKLGRAHALVAARLFTEAEVVLNEVLGADISQASAWRLLGKIYYLTDRLPQAIEAWQTALDFDSTSEDLRKMLAKARREQQVEKDLTRSYAANFILSYDDERHPELGRDLIEVLTEAYVEVGGNLDHYPARQVPVLVYTRQDFSRLTASPDWAAGLYDGKIRISVGGLTSVTGMLRAVLFHEYAHVVVRDLAGPRCPTWLNEGIAEVSGRSQFDPGLQKLDKARDLIGFNSLEGAWKTLPAERVRLAYEQSYSFVRFLVEDYGWFLVADLLRKIGEGKSLEDAFVKAYESYGMDLHGLQRQWLGTLGRH